MDTLNKERMEYLDTAKGIGILCVCLGHACTNQVLLENARFVDLIRFVTLFHMALFFFINGMLYSDKYSTRPISGMMKKIKSYYLPFAGYNLLFWLLHNLFAKLYLISGRLDPKDYPYEGLKAYLVSLVKTLLGFRQRFAGAMWFLECLIVISVLFILIDFLCKKWFARHRLTVLTIVMGIILVLNHLFQIKNIPHLPEQLSQMLYWSLNGLLFFYLGYIYKMLKIHEKFCRWKYVIVSVCTLLLIGAVMIMKPMIVSVITNEPMDLPKYGIQSLIGVGGKGQLSMWQFILYSVVCLAGILLVLQISHTKIVLHMNVFKILGRYSLHIMCLHLLAFKVVSILAIRILDLPLSRLAEYPVLMNVNGFWWIAYTIAGLAIPTCLVFLLRKCLNLAKGKLV